MSPGLTVVTHHSWNPTHLTKYYWWMNRSSNINVIFLCHCYPKNSPTPWTKTILEGERTQASERFFYFFKSKYTHKRDFFFFNKQIILWKMMLLRDYTSSHKGAKTLGQCIFCLRSTFNLRALESSITGRTAFPWAFRKKDKESLLNELLVN